MNQTNTRKKKPLYTRVFEVLAKEIDEGKYSAHDKLPTEMELCDLFSVSRITVRQALDQLERQNYIYKKLGVGTFVSERAFLQDLKKFYSFTDEMIKIGKTPKSQVLTFETIQSDQKISEKCHINIGAEVFLIKRLRLADDTPIMVEHTYLPKQRFEGLSEEMVATQSLYNIFRNNYSVVFSKAIETFKPVLIREDETEFLHIPVGSPGMMIERYTFEWDSIIEYTVSVARGDKFIYRVVLD